MRFCELFWTGTLSSDFGPCHCPCVKKLPPTHWRFGALLPTPGRSAHFLVELAFQVALEKSVEANDFTQGPRGFRIGGSRSARWSAARVITFLGGATACTVEHKGADKVVLREQNHP